MTSSPVERQLRELLASGALDLPRPGGGETIRRFDALLALACDDVAIGRLAEAHVDAVAILGEAGRVAPHGQLLGVWAADTPGSDIDARRTPQGWQLRGTRTWCSGAGVLDAALVTATSDEGPLLVLVDLDQPGVVPDRTSWAADALSSTTTWTVRFDDVRVDAERLIGPPGFYIGRPGFWHGSVGVAAAWAGGALGVAHRIFGADTADPHRLAHAGAVHTATWTLRAVLRTAAEEIDADPDDLAGVGMFRALTVRHVVERTATEIIDRCGRALGPSPLALEAEHARRVADLTLYIRQHKAERDLEAIGSWVASHPAPARPVLLRPGASEP